MELDRHINIINDELLMEINKIRSLIMFNRDNLMTRIDKIKCYGVEYDIYSLIPNWNGAQLLVKYCYERRFDQTIKKVNRIYIVVGNFYIEVPLDIGKKEIKNIRIYNSLMVKKNVDDKRQDFLNNYHSILPDNYLELVSLLNDDFSKKEVLSPLYFKYNKFCMENEDIRKRLIKLKTRIKK